MAMPITFDQTTVAGSTARVAISGDMDLAAVPTIRAVIGPYLRDDNVRNIELDLAGVTFMDCAAIGQLVRLWLSADRYRTALTAIGAHGLVKDTMDLAGISALLTGADSRPSR